MFRVKLKFQYLTCKNYLKFQVFPGFLVIFVQNSQFISDFFQISMFYFKFLKFQVFPGLFSLNYQIIGFLANMCLSTFKNLVSKRDSIKSQSLFIKKNILALVRLKFSKNLTCLGMSILHISYLIHIDITTLNFYITICI